MADIIKDFMVKVMDDYKGEKRIKASSSILAWKIRSSFPQMLRERVFPGNVNYTVHGWIGSDTWADNPFVSIKHREAKDAGKDALSIMYIFSADMQSCYLALMLPWEQIEAEHIAGEATVVRNEIRPYNRCLTLEVMDLKSGSKLANLMEEACVFCREYNRSNLPDEMMLQADLANVITMYENHIRINKFGVPALKVRDGSVDRVYIKYRLGSPNAHCHCEAIHADIDSYTQQMVESICKRSGCSGIITTASSQRYDLNRPANPRNMEAVYEYRDTIHRILQHMEILDPEEKVLVPYLHVAIHAIKAGYPNGPEIKVSYGEPASFSLVNWFCNKVRDKTKDISDPDGSPVRVNMQFVDKKSRQFQRYGENGQRFNGENKAYHFILVEISEDLRCLYRDDLVKGFSEIIRDFTREFGRNKSGTWHERHIG